MDEKVIDDVESSFVGSTIQPLTPLQYRKFIWKLDIHLLPPIVALWFMIQIDRVNIGSANIFGIQADLDMDPHGHDFIIVLVLLVVGLVTMEVPTTYLVKRTSPSLVLSAKGLLLDNMWRDAGIFTVAQGVVKTKKGLYAIRYFIGACEAGVAPGSIFLMSQYYPRYELQWRVSVMMVGIVLSNAFGGLLAFAIAGIKSGNGYHPWRWIFIIEGCITAIVSIVVYFLISNLPSTAKWLTDSEREVLSEKIKSQGGIGRMDTLDWKAAKRILLDWKIYISGIMMCCITLTAYSVSIFSPTIINQFSPSHSPRHAQALAIPIFVVATVVCLATAYISDKLKHRASFIFFGFVLTIIGSALPMNQQLLSAHGKYASLFLLAAGVYMALPMLWGWLVNNVSGGYKVAVAVAMETALGDLGGIASALVFQGYQGPQYSEGYRTVLGMSVVGAGLVIILVGGMWWENKMRDTGKRQYRLEDPDLNNLGDDHPLFRFGY